MPYRIAGIDVHKKMLAVVWADVEEMRNQYQFERKRFASNPQQLRMLAQWLIEQEVVEVVMESTAQYWQPVWESVGTILEAPLSNTDRDKTEGGSTAPGTSPIQSWAAGAEERFSRCRTSGETAGGRRTQA